MTFKLGLTVSAALAVAGFAAPAAQAAVSTIWSMSAGTPIMREFDLNGNLLKSITAPVSGNGRGIVQVGDILYYTLANSPNVFAYNFVTNTDLGVKFTVSGSSGLATIAYDGKNFWLGDYSGTKNAYNYSPTGTLLKTVSLGKCTSYCDGLEYANGHLVSNRYDGGYGGSNTYDVYDLNGNLLTSTLIVGHDSRGNTGIAFDGTYYYVDNVFSGTFDRYNSAGVWLNTITLSTGSIVGEDLSVNYAQVLGIPEPASWALMLIGVGALGAGLRTNRRAKALAA